MNPETKAKWKRAEELVMEAGDMDSGEAAVMFIIAAVQAQRNYYDEIVRKTLNGEVVKEIEHLQDLDMFRVIKHIIGPAAHAKSRDAFMKSALYEKNRNDILVKSLTDTLHRIVLAWTLRNEIEKRGGNLYDL